MGTYYCVKNPSKCDGSCDICPQPYKDQQLEFDFGWVCQEASRVVEEAPKDEVNNPEHYTLGSIEVFDFIKAWQLSFAEGNVIKYTVRAPYKGHQLKDLKKARWYIDQLIKEAEKNDHV